MLRVVLPGHVVALRLGDFRRQDSRMSVLSVRECRGRLNGRVAVAVEGEGRAVPEDEERFKHRRRYVIVQDQGTPNPEVPMRNPVATTTAMLVRNHCFGHPSCISHDNRLPTLS